MFLQVLLYNLMLISTLLILSLVIYFMSQYTTYFTYLIRLDIVLQKCLPKTKEINMKIHIFKAKKANSFSFSIFTRRDARSAISRPRQTILAITFRLYLPEGPFIKRTCILTHWLLFNTLRYVYISWTVLFYLRTYLSSDFSGSQSALERSLSGYSIFREKNI